MDDNEVLVNNNETFDYSNIKIANYTETLDTVSNNNNDSLDFSTMNQHNQVTYVADITCKARFLSLANVFIA